MNRRDSARPAVNGRDPAGGETSTSLDVGTASSRINEIGHLWEMLFKGIIWISRCHSLLRLLLVHVFYLIFVVNKLCEAIWEKKFSCYVFSRITEDIEVTQEINCTGIIPLEALRTQHHKGLTFWKEAFLEDVTDHIQINYVFSTHSEETLPLLPLLRREIWKRWPMTNSNFSHK